MWGNNKQSVSPIYYPQQSRENQYAQVPSGGGNSPVPNAIQLTSYPPSTAVPTVQGQVVGSQPGMMYQPGMTYQPQGTTVQPYPQNNHPYPTGTAYMVSAQPYQPQQQQIYGQPQAYVYPGQVVAATSVPGGGTTYPYVAPKGGYNKYGMVLAGIGVFCCCFCCVVIPVLVAVLGTVVRSSGWYNRVYYLDSSCLTPVVHQATPLDTCIYLFDTYPYQTVKFSASGSTSVDVQYYSDYSCATSAYATPVFTTTGCPYDSSSGLYSEVFVSAGSFSSSLTYDVIINDGHSLAPSSSKSSSTYDSADPSEFVCHLNKNVSFSPKF
jgi:hypothetical protein